MEAIEAAGEHLKAFAAALDRLVHLTGVGDRRIGVVGGDHEHGRHGELLDGGPGVQRDAADQVGRVGLTRQRDHRGDRGLDPGPGDQYRRAAHGRPDQGDPGGAAAAQLGRGGGDVVDHPPAGVALGAGRPPKAAQVDGEGAQAPLGQVVGERPEAAQVAGVLVGQHHPGRAGADQDAVQAGPVGCLEADQGGLGGGGAAAGGRLLQRLEGRRDRGRGLRCRAAVGAGVGAARAGGGDQRQGGEAGGDPSASPALG
jgi:hypothetical protein